MSSSVRPHAGAYSSVCASSTRDGRTGQSSGGGIDTNQAVAGISFTVAEGELVGYIGPNGAGKSTTVKLLTGILVPTAGDVRLCVLGPLAEGLARAGNGREGPLSRRDRVGAAIRAWRRALPPARTTPVARETS